MYHRIVFFHPLDETLLCGISCSFMFGNERREGGENHVAEDLDGAFLWLCILLSQLVAVGIAHRQDRCSYALYLHTVRWLYLSADGWRMDEPTAQKQPYGRCFQHGERKFHAGNTIDGK